MSNQILSWRGSSLFLVLVSTSLWNSKPILAEQNSNLWLTEKFSLESHVNYKTQDSLNQAQLSANLNQKSENAALALSALGTLIPIGLGLAATGASEGPEGSPLPGIMILSGVLVGPSLGYFYGGLPWRGLASMGLRLGGTVAVGAAIAISWNDADNSSAEMLAWSGAALLVGSMVYDIASVKRTVRKHNRSLREKALIITPAYFAKSGAAGLQMQIKF